MNHATTARNAAELKLVNRSNVLSLLLKAQPLARSDLTSMTGLTPPTITKIIAELIEDGIVREVGPTETEEGRMGRRRQMLELVPDSHFVLGVHLGFSESLLGLVDVTGTVVQSEQIHLNLSAKTGAEDIDQVALQAREFLDGCAVSEQSLIGVGVGVPGPLRNITVQESFQPYFRSPILSDYNVRTMAMGEYFFARKQQVDSLVFIYVGRGIAAGIVLNGQIWRGIDGRAGDIGYARVTDRDILSETGCKGCLDALVSEGAIAAQIRARFPELEHESDIALILEVLQRSEDGIPPYIDFVHELADNLYLGVQPIVDMLNPELIVIGGRITGAWGGISDRINGHIAQERWDLNGVDVALSKSLLGEQAVIVGAAAQILVSHFYGVQL